MKIILFTLLIMAVAGCNQTEKKTEPTEAVIMAEPDGGIGDGAVSPAIAFAQGIENAHNKSEWKNKRAVSFDLNLSLDGKERITAKITSLTNSGKIRIDKGDGTKIVFTGEEVFLCPEDTGTENARFDIFTWQHFFALPFKLTDSGTSWELTHQKKLNGELFYTGRLTFKDSTGDSPIDRYLIYQETETGLLHAAAYEVTSNSHTLKAEKNLHAIVYRDYIVQDGLPLSTRWTFHNWDEATGIGDQIGEATITNITFFNARDELFNQPEHSKIVDK